LLLVLPAVAQVDTAWVRRYNGPGGGGNGAYDLAVDDSGNVYVTGYSDSATGVDYLTIKYDGDGDIAPDNWPARYNGPGNGGNEAVAITVDDSGNVYITGYSDGIGTSNDYATIKVLSQWRYCVGKKTRRIRQLLGLG
jgi:hypothetical protein